VTPDTARLRHGNLLLALQVAVPLRISELQELPPQARRIQAALWASTAADVIGGHGDDLLYGGRPGQAAAVFGTLARGLAAAAHAPGGVTVLGGHWCTDHAACRRAEAAAEAAMTASVAPRASVSG
jgi:hypothetical protein